MAEEVRPWTWSGFGPKDQEARNLFRSDHPSLRDILAKESQFREGIEETKSDPKFTALDEADKSHGCLARLDRAYLDPSKEYKERFEAKLDKTQKYRKAQKHHLGQAYSASGERSKASIVIPNARVTVDWGLIELDSSRMGSNLVATLGQTDLGPFEGNKQYNHHHQGPIRQGLRLFKCGRTTGYTKGQYNGLKTVHLTHAVENGELTPQATLEHTITRQDGVFALRGDSGALIVDAQARVVGLHWAGLDSGAVAYFTHIADVFDDIKRATGAEEIRMMEDV